MAAARFVMSPLRHPETLPVIGCVAAGLVFMTYKSVRCATSNPDVHFDRTARSTNARDTEEARKWGEGARAHSRRGKDGVDVEYVSVLHPIAGLKALFATRTDDAMRE